tara:strand:+ start:1527 stop:1646 length:120 start_codon:yes stop_codon:yes gene_type:complete
MGYKEKIVVIPLALVAIGIFGAATFMTVCKHSFFNFLGC